MDVEDILWAKIAKQTNAFSEDISHHSDAFELLAAILAYYQTIGTPPDKLIGPFLKNRVSYLSAQAVLESSAD